MRRLILLCLYVIMLGLAICPASVAYAGSSDSVVVTASGYVEDMAPIDFTVTYISDYEIQLTWVNPPSTNTTEVRAAIGRLPTSRNDGYIVYSGNGTMATDWVNLVTVDDAVYYAAWRMNDAGTWSTTPATGDTRGVSMTLIGLAAIALVLSTLGYRYRSPMFAVAGGGFWLALSIFFYQLSDGPWDLYYVLFWFCMGLSFGVILESILLYRKSKMTEKEDMTDQKMIPSRASYRERMEKFREERGLRPRTAKSKPLKESEFTRTGRM